MRKIYFNFFSVICLILACLYRNLQEKIGNNYVHFVNITFKILRYHKALTYFNRSQSRLRYVSLKEHFILKKNRNTLNLLKK